MGATSKPLHIILEQSLYDANKEQWSNLEAQGHTVEVITGSLPDLYLASFAMRITPTMMAQLPSAIELAIKGARTLRYAPTAKDTMAWKGGKAKSAKAKGTHKRAHAKVTAKATNIGEQPTQAEDRGTGGTTVSTVGTATNNEGATQVE